MRRKPFLLFSLIVLVLVFGVVGFIQSAQFALLLKRGLVKYLPRDLGVQADFSELAIGLFPPSLSLRNPLIEVEEKNSIDLPAGTRVRAERLELRFLPFQIFAGNVRISQIAVVDGEVFLPLDPSKNNAPKAARKKTLGVSWGDLLQVRIDSFALERTRLQFELSEPRLSVSLMAEEASISQAEVTGGPGYELSLKVRDVTASLPKSWNVGDLRLERIVGLATVSAKEFRLIGLDAEGMGSRVKTSLEITGDILKPAGFPVRGDLELEGNLPIIVSKVFPQFNAKNDPKNEIEGKLRFEGKIETRLDRIVENLQAKGLFRISDFRWKNWRADDLEIEGGFEQAGEGGPILNVARAFVSAAERPRLGGYQLASGGRVELGAFQWKPQSFEPLTVSAKLQSAHLHWLVAGSPKDVYGLDFRINGEVLAKVQPTRKKDDWSVTADLKLVIPRFQLDNQRYQQNKPLRPILVIPELALEGAVHVDSRELRPEGLFLSLKKTKLGVTGKIDFKNGWDLNGAGEVDLSEIESLAASKIGGEGSLAVHVHGPTARVLIDFDAKLKAAEYLGLKLGALQGRITYDDDPSDLLFQKIELQKGRTEYEVDGKIALGIKEAIDLDVKIPKGRFEELGDVFSTLTDPIGWYPKSLIGDVKGTVKVTGPPDFSLMEIRARLDGADWDYFGERLRDVKLQGGYVRGKYLIESFVARKQDARINASISYDSDDRIEWSVATQGLQVQSFDRILRLDVPMRGALELRSSGKGKFGAIESDTLVALNRLTVRGQSLPDSELSLFSSAGKLKVNGKGFGEQGELSIDYDSKIGSPSRFRVLARSLDFSPFLLILNPALAPDPLLVARISGELDLSFNTGSEELASGRGELKAYQLNKTGGSWTLVSPVSVRIAGGTFESTRVSITGAGQTSELRLRANAGAIDGTVSGAWSPAIVEFVTSTVEQASGRVLVDGRIAGRWKEPIVSGVARLDGISVRTSLLESPFEDVRGLLRLSQNVISLERVESDLANGRFAAGGSVTLHPDRVPELALNAQINGSRIKVFPFQFVKVRGKFQIRGKELPYLVDGTVVADSGLIREKILNNSAGQGLRTARYTPPPARRDSGDLPMFKIDLDAKAERGILVQNDLFDAELKGQVRLVNTVDNPRPIGSAEIVQGRMNFKDQIFQIQSGSARFDSPVSVNPAFNLNASTEVGSTKIQLFASGRVDDYKIELSSNPVLAENEILSLLTIGATGADARRLRAGSSSTFEQGEAASLLLHSLDFNRDVEERTGFQIQIGEATDSQTATSVTRPRGETETSASPKIIIRRNIGKNVSVSVGSTVGVGNSSQREVNLEYQVTPGVSVNGVWDSRDGDTARTDNPYSYGLDLKLQKRFK